MFEPLDELEFLMVLAELLSRAPEVIQLRGRECFAEPTPELAELMMTNRADDPEKWAFHVIVEAMACVHLHVPLREGRVFDLSAEPLKLTDIERLLEALEDLHLSLRNGKEEGPSLGRATSQGKDELPVPQVQFIALYE